MQLRRELLIAIGLAALGSMRADGEPAADGSRASNPLDLGEFGKRKEPIFITSDSLEYDYKMNVVVYHGDVHATQGPVTLRSDTLTITLEKTDQEGPSDAPKGDPPKADPPKSNPRLRQIIAAGHVRMDDGTRTATGGRAVFEQSERTVVLTENPVLHEGTNEVIVQSLRVIEVLKQLIPEYSAASATDLSPSVISVATPQSATERVVN